jgi:phenylacetate-CoA ligase
MIYPFILKNFVLPLGSKLMGGGISKKIKEYESILSLQPSEIAEVQRKKLNQVLEYAVQNSPYYRSLFSDKNLPSTEISSYPILTKQTLRDKIDEIITVKGTANLHQILSSGSTGPPSKVYYTSEELAIPRAIQLIWWSWAGYEYGNSILQTGVNLNRSKEKQIKDFFFRTKYIEALKHNEEQILQELSSLQSENRDHFVGYASSLFLFSKVALDNEIKNVQFKSVISLGEKLLPNFRESIEKAFSCKVFDTYGSSEGLMVASQCKHGTYHIMSPHVYVEILDENGVEVKPGEIGSVVLTGLDNFTTPLIRYDIGDMAVKGDSSACVCGLNLPHLGEIIGRSTEFIQTQNKKYITVQTVVRIMKFYPQIEQFTLIKKEDNSLQLQYIGSENLSEDIESQITKSFSDLYDESFEIDFLKVNQLPRRKSGKYQLIMNLSQDSK